MKVALKILAALAAIAGAVYVVATYGDQIVAWAKKLLDAMPKCPCCKDDACTCADEDVCKCDEEKPCKCGCTEEEPCACQAPAEEAPVEEAPAEEAPAAPVADETDFEA